MDSRSRFSAIAACLESEHGRKRTCSEGGIRTHDLRIMIPTL